MSSIVTYIRQLYTIVRCWRYRRNPEYVDKLNLQDFIEYAQEFKLMSGLRPLLITEDGIFIHTVSGFFVLFDPRYEHSILWGVEKDGVWEPGITKLCINKLCDGGTFLDIGANVGMFSMSIANENKHVNIHAFEPIPTNFSVLKKNIKLNKMEEKIVINNLALSYQRSTISLVVNGQLSHVFNGISKEEKLPTVAVNTVSVDYYCETNNITNVKLIKCDVEGFELDVVRGAEKVITTQKPSIVLEIEERWTTRYGHSAKDVFSFLQELGYTGIPILYDGTLGDKNNPVEQKLNQSNAFLFEIE